ncbi:MAG: indole-3-glycerol phosphate synthase TrpC [Mangrovimonas sp.]|nr:indole-3-glycerol phosphate synthase TrpC [Mangrovimonas sp.]MCB0438492.1 indole-3-glycerol phosphate synthase TrpC [Mangrovimonas sp.]
MSILDNIIAHKRSEVGLKKSQTPISQLEQSPLFSRATYSLKTNLMNSPSGIIAEHKRKSPSKAVINNSLNLIDVAKGYENAGVSGMSVLTDEKYFGGTLEDLKTARNTCNLPLLRKEFIISEYQIIEAKASGADLILLIAAILTKDEIKSYSELAKSLGLEVLLEVHNLEELEKSMMPSLDMIGVNNRNLKTFEVSLDISKSLSEKIPDDFVKVSESGINNVAAIKDLRAYGYQGFLIGENFMKTSNPGNSASQFINELNR